jgi:AAA ATPase-like protein
MLYGRRAELAAIGRLLEGMRCGRAGVLVLRGEAGTGKTAMLDAAARQRPRRGCCGHPVRAITPYAALSAPVDPAQAAVSRPALRKLLQ